MNIVQQVITALIEPATIDGKPNPMVDVQVPEIATMTWGEYQMLEDKPLISEIHDFAPESGNPIEFFQFTGILSQVTYQDDTKGYTGVDFRTSTDYDDDGKLGLVWWRKDPANPGQKEIGKVGEWSKVDLASKLFTHYKQNALRVIRLERMGTKDTMLALMRGETHTLDQD